MNLFENLLQFVSIYSLKIFLFRSPGCNGIPTIFVCGAGPGSTSLTKNSSVHMHVLLPTYWFTYLGTYILVLWLLQPFYGPWILSGTTRLSRYQKGKTRKVKPIWIYWNKRVSGSGISWAICQPAPHPRHTTTPASHHSAFYKPDALPALPSQPTASKYWRHYLGTYIHTYNIK